MNKEEKYQIPIYENGKDTGLTIDGIVGDGIYQRLIELSNGKGLPTIVNTNLKIINKNEQSR